MQVRDLRHRLLERARALGLDGSDEEQLIDDLLDREVQPPPPTDDDCRRFYAEHAELFRSGDLVEADHILFAVTDKVPLAALRSRAQQALDEVLAAPERFTALARDVSNCPSGRDGGSLGQIARGDVVPEFWQAINAFAGTGIAPRLIETRHGLHLLRVRRRIEGRAAAYDAVRQRIADRLAERNLRRALRDYALAQVAAAVPEHDQPRHAGPAGQRR